MPNFEPLQNSIPIAPLKLASLEGCLDFANLVDKHLSDYRHENPTHTKDSIAYRGYLEDSYLIDCCCPRFGSGEAKGILKQSVRGTDLFILADVLNYSLTYTVCGYENHMSPDNHYQDLKRIISAANGKATSYQRDHAVPLRGTSA